jgi:hypothetical protein
MTMTCIDNWNAAVKMIITVTYIDNRVVEAS